MASLRTTNRRARNRKRVIRRGWRAFLEHELWMRTRGKRTGGLSLGTIRWYLYGETYEGS